MTLLLLLLACPASKDSSTSDTDAGSDSAEDSGALPVATLDEAPWRAHGEIGDGLGMSIALGGDLTGDGVGDLVVGGFNGGKVCVFAGPLSSGSAHLSDAWGCWVQEELYDFAGFSAAIPGDVTGDGAPDLLVGAIGADAKGGDSGIVYLLAGPLPQGGGSLGSAFAVFQGEGPGEYAGSGVAPAGDVNGDGQADFLLGASGNNDGGAGGGKAYLFLGPLTEPGLYSIEEAFTAIQGSSPIPAASRPLDPLFHGAATDGDGVGYALDGVGDLNGDGLDDIAIGAGGSDDIGANTGKAAIFFGPAQDAVLALADADVAFQGETEQAFAGDPVSGAGDTDGDGHADLLLAADGVGVGAVYLWKGTVRAGGVSLGQAPTILEGEGDGDQLGAALSRAGDADGDGFADVAIGAWANDASDLDAGRAYLLYGPLPEGRAAIADVLASSRSSAWAGEVSGDYAGRMVSGGADLTGDGLPDLLIAAPYSATNGPTSGTVYLFPGQ